MTKSSPSEPPPDVRGVPVFLLLDDVATIFRQSPWTIRDKVQKGLFHPPPCLKYPYRWKKSDIERAIEQQTVDHRYAKHGFATRKLRPVAATLRRAKKS